MVISSQSSQITSHLNTFNLLKNPDLRFNRLKVALRSFDFDVVYRPGRINKNADALSRNPVLAAGEQNPERPRAELYQLASEQEREDSDVDEKQPPASIFVTHAIKKKGINKDKKIKRDKSDSEKSGKELNTTKSI